MAVPLNTAIPADGPEEVVQLLLVDDQPANLEALEAMLALSGCRFVLARSAEEALLALLEQDFAAIVLDIRMPGMSGLELAKLIKGRKRSQHVPILFLTAHMMDEKDELEGYAAGAVDYLTKPIRPQILRSKIAVFVDLNRKTKALARANEALHKGIEEREHIEERLRVVNQELEDRVEERTWALSEAGRRKDEFLAALAHELRNPLGAMRTAAELFRMKAPTGSDLNMPQGVMDRQLRQMTRLIDDLLDVSRITRDKLELRKERIELQKVILAAVETSRPTITERKHELLLELPPEPIMLNADFARLSQVFSNLLDNAAKYTEPGGRIRVTAEQRGGRALVRVLDNGPGIDLEALPRIFELFVQAHTSPGLGHGGLGIGLTLVRRLVEMHGGTVAAHSSGAGKGAEFLISLPIQNGTQQMTGSPEPGSEIVLKQAFRVLVVEDNRDAADVLRVLLTSWGQDVRVAYDALAGLDIARQFQPQVILMDIGLPQMHGYDLARRLRELPFGRQTILVAVTGWGHEADRQQSKASGINHHLLKPVDPDALKALLATFKV